MASDIDDEVYDLNFNEEPVKLRQTDGTVVTYTLREFDGDARDDYLTSIAAGMEINTEKGTGKMNNMKGVQSRLISMCMFTPEGELVELDFVKKLPARIQTKLFERCQALCGMGSGGDKEDDEKK